MYKPWYLQGPVSWDWQVAEGATSQGLILCLQRSSMSARAPLQPTPDPVTHPTNHHTHLLLPPPSPMTDPSCQNAPFAVYVSASRASLNSSCFVGARFCFSCAALSGHALGDCHLSFLFGLDILSSHSVS